MRCIRIYYPYWYIRIRNSSTVVVSLLEWSLELHLTHLLLTVFLNCPAPARTVRTYAPAPARLACTCRPGGYSFQWNRAAPPFRSQKPRSPRDVKHWSHVQILSGLWTYSGLGWTSEKLGGRAQVSARRGSHVTRCSRRLLQLHLQTHWHRPTSRRRRLAAREGAPAGAGY